MNFDFKTEQLDDDGYVISLAGEVDLYTAPEFKAQLLDVIGKGAKQVIVDFTDTTFIDSTTLGVLVGGVKRLRTNDGELSLVCSDRNITKIFEITGLDRVFTIYPTRHEAIDRSAPRAARLALSRRARALGDARRHALATAGCGTGGLQRRRRQGKRQAAVQSRSAAPATRSQTPARRGRSARTSTTRSPGPASRVSPSRPSAASSTTRSSSRSRTRPASTSATNGIETKVTGMPAQPRHRRRRERRRRLRRLRRRAAPGRRHVHRCGDHACASTGSDDDPGDHDHADDHDDDDRRRGRLRTGRPGQAGFRDRRLHQLPHAEGRERDRDGRTRTSTTPSRPRLVVDRVTNGKGVMPSFKGQLTPQQIARGRGLRLHRRRHVGETAAPRWPRLPWTHGLAHPPVAQRAARRPRRARGRLGAVPRAGARPRAPLRGVDFRFLIWNLFLAWIPLLLALLVYDRYRRGRPLLVLAPALVLWLLFLPNAPYIVTDFVHLSAGAPAAALVRRGRALRLRVDGHAARLRLAVPRARGRRGTASAPCRLGRRPRRARARQRRRLPRAGQALEQLGRAHAAALTARAAARPPRRSGLARPGHRRHARDDVPRSRSPTSSSTC